MEPRTHILNPVVAAFAGFFVLSSAQATETDQLDTLLEELRQPDNDGWQRLERQITRLWSRSGSATADLLLQRGRDAMRRGDTTAALEHFTAVVDHAPDFAEGYHARATAFFMDGRLGQALDDLAEVLARNPNHFAALAGLGRIFEDLSQPERARDAYRAASAIHPHRADVKAALDRLDRRLNGTTL
ncbi:MAG: tetratricopeptide repeat protein [Roseinatronobacter sp.]